MKVEKESEAWIILEKSMKQSIGKTLRWEGLSEVIFSKGPENFYTVNRMHFINTIADGPHLNPLSICVQVTWPI